jgi:glucose-6-phosphate-specific signal transduction histidine kinase
VPGVGDSLQLVLARVLEGQPGAGHQVDADATTFGTGVQGMADRLDAIGGSLDIRSAPGEGTRVRGEVMVDGRAPLDAV